MAGRRREQGTVRGAKPRPRDLTTEDLELVAQDEQLDVLDAQATATPNEVPPSRARNATQRNEKVTAPILPTRPAKGATRVLAPFRRKRATLRVRQGF